MQAAFMPRLEALQDIQPRDGSNDMTSRAAGYHSRKLFPGINLITLNLPAGERFETEFVKLENTFEFAFVLNGQARSSLKSMVMKPIELSSRSTVTHYLPEMPGIFEVAPAPCIQMLGIEVTTGLLRQLLGPENVTRSKLSGPLKSGSKIPFIRQGKMNAMQSAVVSQIFSCPFDGRAGQLFLQSKVLELISIQLQMFSQPCVSASPEFLSAEDEERIRYARRFLKSHMTDAPGLVALSKAAGISLSKLKKGFKIVYGRSAFACLHEDRMERAYALLSERRMNVSQVAWEVGYINVGHFSAAFRKRFGIRPKTFQLNPSLVRVSG